MSTLCTLSSCPIPAELPPLPFKLSSSAQASSDAFLSIQEVPSQRITHSTRGLKFSTHRSLLLVPFPHRHAALPRPARSTPNHHLRQPPSQLARPRSLFQAPPRERHPSLSSAPTLSLVRLSSLSHPHSSSRAPARKHRFTFRFARRPLNGLRVLRNTRKFVRKSTTPSTSTPSHFAASRPTEPQIAHEYV